MRSSRHRFIRIFGFAAVLAICGCKSVVATEERVEIRVRNASAVDFTRVVVSFPDQTEEYGVVAARSASDYRAVERAYRYAGVQVTFEGVSLALIPIDYVGEEELEGGSYTYELNLTEDSGSLTFRLVRD